MEGGGQTIEGLWHSLDTGAMAITVQSVGPVLSKHQDKESRFPYTTAAFKQAKPDLLRPRQLGTA